MNPFTVVFWLASRHESPVADFVDCITSLTHTHTHTHTCANAHLKECCQCNGACIRISACFLCENMHVNYLQHTAKHLFIKRWLWITDRNARNETKKSTAGRFWTNCCHYATCHSCVATHSIYVHMCKLHALNSAAFVASLAKKASSASLQVICVGINLAKLPAARQTKRTQTHVQL